MKTVDGKVIRIKGNRREERARIRKRFLTAFMYLVLIAMILVLCGILINWMIRPHEKVDQFAVSEDTELTEETITESAQTASDHTSEILPTAEIDPVALMQVQELLADFKVAALSGSSNPAVHPEKYTLSGRWYQTLIDGVLCNNTVTQGAMVFFKISGTNGFDIRFFNRAMMETPYFAYSIDGGAMQRQSVSDGHVELPDYGEHTVCLVMDGISEREFKWSGEIGFAFSDIECGNGTMSAYTPDKRTILFLGDSLTEGIMTLGPESLSDYNSAVHSYSWYLAQGLDALPYFSAYGSTGITKTGSFNTMSATLDYLSETRPIAETDYPACNLVVLNAGTNDFDASDADFSGGYSDLLNKLHNRYPAASIVCVIPLNQTHADTIRQAAGQYDFAYVVETGDWAVTYSDAEHIHPDDAGSHYIAEKLADYIKEKQIF